MSVAIVVTDSGRRFRGHDPILTYARSIAKIADVLDIERVIVTEGSQ